MPKNNIIKVFLFGEEVARIGRDEYLGKCSFQYHPRFLEQDQYTNIFPKTGIIKRVPQVQVFGQYDNDTFKGLPPPIADSLPDVFGNIVFKTWLEATQKSNITILEQLAYLSNRGMGALEFQPSIELPKRDSIDLDEIIAVLKAVLDTKKQITPAAFDSDALLHIFKMGTSAGGARPKIILSKHKITGNIIPGDLEYSDAYEHYLVKLALDASADYPREVVEYCYHLTARALGIQMMDSTLIDHQHFATLRFDRQHGTKQHVLTATGLTGWDYQKATHSSYENLFKLASFLKVSQAQLEQLYLRMVFNVIFRNTDDHLKNHTFIYDPLQDSWDLSPAYDLTYALNPLVDFKQTHRALSINGKRHNIDPTDMLYVADLFTIKNPKGIIQKVQSGVAILKQHLDDHDIPVRVQQGIMKGIGRF